MKIITFQNEHKRKHFEFFNSMNHPHFCITAPFDVTLLRAYSRAENLPFTPLMVYYISRAANEIAEFRWRIRENNTVVEHETVHPSFTVQTDVADVFSFCEVGYKAQGAAFVAAAEGLMKRMRTEPSFEDAPHRDDYLFLSAIPWLAFTSVQHAMFYHPTDSVPRITWGKYLETNGKTSLPLSVQAHHALVDGRHIGLFFEKMEQLIASHAGF